MTGPTNDLTVPATYREASERIVRAVDSFCGAHVIEIMCECDIRECVSMIPISRDDFEAVCARSSEASIVTPGHATTAQVIEQRPDHWLIGHVG